ncbi:uncharacterized protein LOC116295138 [Actinia tenebrosa]|uniref:Uncharacterized protein LOC116295138 n=1 Tax=Actinia tenebrosa TaxID=6105 RepID=A0A6P8I1I3_ACTTE|nr:uncharacterized protein LOC116295138 [Actinia tenebrosa]
METEEEWAFINIQIQKRYHTEWYTSLRKVDGDWLWPNNQSFTIDKWQPMEPNGDGSCAVMAKKWPWEERGLFNDIFCAVGRESICEYSHENPTCNSSKLLWCNKALGDDSPQQLETGNPKIKVKLLLVVCKQRFKIH